jgi:UDP-N-acetylmuramoyl-L-alanyl-D-glutamate--2,6-diaminopimelate ligase
MLKKIIKKILPKKLLLAYHYLLAKLAAWYYLQPSQEIIVIGVTGTNGKTTTVNFISQYLECLGQSIGLMSTVNFKVGAKEWLNDKKMTMLGRWQTQKLLRQMVNNGCQYAIIETSSQGIEQFRHRFINYDLAIFTNLTPEHIEAHGSFTNYRAQKEKLFAHVATSRVKTINGHQVPKIIISNADDEETERLRSYKVDKFLTYGLKSGTDYQATELKLDNGFLSFKIKDGFVKTKFLGNFTVYNILAALAAVESLGFVFQEAVACQLRGVPGRQEFITEGQDFLVMVDYAPEPVSLQNLYGALRAVKKNKLIHVLGSCGGGRDKARQPVLGKLAAQNAELVIVTNEDPYDDDPQEIINNLAQAALQENKILDKNLFKILDRKEALHKALSLAQAGDMVLVTGKGAEQFICGANGQKIPWDDRLIIKELLKNKRI